jgi:hypothetical protein
MRTAVVALAATLAAPLAAQVRASERAVVAQTVDGTTITIEYSRPVARGRDSLFGRVVHWGEVWTPGANWATTLDVDRDIQLNGHPVPRGKYSVWMIPRREGDWTFFLSKTHRAFHTQRPNPDNAVISFPVTPQPAPHVEVLTWWFPAVAADGASLHMQWGTTLLASHIVVTPSRPVARAAQNLMPYAGRYRLAWSGSGDAAAPDSAARAGRQTFITVFVQDGRLRGRWEPAQGGLDAEFDLLPHDDRGFTPRYYMHGRPHEEDRETLIVFQVQGRQATGLEMRFEREVYARGQRVP